MEFGKRLVPGQFDAMMQIVNLMKIAAAQGREQVLDGLRAARTGSIGPTTTETLEEYGLKADFEPNRRKMGLLVNEMAARFHR